MKSVCKRCGVVHTGTAADPKKIVEKLAEDIAKEIDRELLASLQREQKK